MHCVIMVHNSTQVNIEKGFTTFDIQGKVLQANNNSCSKLLWENLSTFEPFKSTKI